MGFMICDAPYLENPIYIGYNRNVKNMYICTKEEPSMAFLASFLQYVIILIVLACVGILGGFIGSRLRKKKNASLAVDAAVSEVQKEK